MARYFHLATLPALVTGVLFGLLALLSTQSLSANPPGQNAIDLAAPRVPGELLVKFRPESDRASTQAILERMGGKVQAHIPAIGVSLVKLPEAGLLHALEQLNAHPDVEFAEPNYLLDLDDIFVPNDPNYALYQKTYLDRLEMPAAWMLSSGDPSAIIAIIDTGIYRTHEDLAGAIWLNPGEIPGNGKDDDLNGFVDDTWGWDFAYGDNEPVDDHGHGTHVAGIAAARTDNGKGIAGMAGGKNGTGGARVMAVKIFRGIVGTYAALTQGIVYAVDNGARIINMSLGAYSYSRAEEAAVNYAWQRGAVLVAAAGNSAKSYVHYPSAHPNVIGVSATTAEDTPAAFTNFGFYVSVAAPGATIYSTYLQNTYVSLSGTSMATPHVSGLAALIWARNPRLTNSQVRQIIQNSADDLGAPDWDPYYGFGRINARKALELADRTPLATPTPFHTPAPQPVWPPDCQELIQAGSFELPDLSAWHITGEVTRTQSPAPSPAYGQWAIKLAGQAGTSGELWQNISVPATATALTLSFGNRIESQDTAWGPDPNDPHTDHLRGEFRDASGHTLYTFLQAGNWSDSSNMGLAWDNFLYPLPIEDVKTLHRAGTVQLYFYADNNPAPSPPTTFYLDDIRLCAGRCTQAGDVNADTLVDLVDVMQVAGHWPASAGSPIYVPAFDLNQDGQIDVVDVMEVAAHWGESCFSNEPQ